MLAKEHGPMNTRRELLDELRIGRSAAPPGAPRSRRSALIACSVAIVLASSSAAWWVASRPKNVEVDAVPRAALETPQDATAGVPIGSRSDSTLDAAGYVVARRLATVASKTIGRVVELPINEGDRVEEDQILAKLDDSNARAAVEEARARVAQNEASLEAAETAFEDARPIFERAERLRQTNVISAQQFDNDRAVYNAAQSAVTVNRRSVDLARASLEVALRSLDDTVVRAPFGGVVTARSAQVGEIVSPSSAGGGFTRTGIGTIVDMDSLEVEVDVSENFINRVFAGQAVGVKLNAYPDTEIPGRVIAVIPTADRATATVKVRVGFAKRDPRVLPDMGARISFQRTASTAAGEQPPAQALAAATPTAVALACGDTAALVAAGDGEFAWPR
jgi:RND family efflux transporter MFP subunit